MVMEDLEAAGYSATQAFSLLYSGGLKIYSTQDPTIQAICDEVCSNEENYPDGTTWYLNYQLTIQHANGETNNYSKEMLEDYLKQNGSDKKYMSEQFPCLRVFLIVCGIIAKFYCILPNEDIQCFCK